MIIGVTGPAGAGKDTSANYIAKKFGIPHVSGGDILREMLTKAGLDPRKSALGPFGVFIRTVYGGDEIPRRVIEKAGTHGSLVYSGFRSPLEAQVVEEKDGVVVYIDAPDEVRYQRIGDRARNGDDVTIKELRALDRQESTAGAAENENLADVKKIANYIVMNDGTAAQLNEKLDKICDQISHRYG